MPNTTKQGAGDVLIVEDEQPIAEMIEAFLTEEGYRVRSVRNAQTAWHAIESAVPAVLLLDILLPGSMDGAALAEQLRAAGYTFPIVIIAATERLAQPILGLDPIVYLGKPFDLEALLDSVARYLPPASRALGGPELA